MTLWRFCELFGIPRQRRWKDAIRLVRQRSGGIQRIIIPTTKVHAGQLGMKLFAHTGIRKQDVQDIWAHVPDEDGLRQVIDHLGLHKFTYVEETGDCDNYALALAGLAGLTTGVNAFAYISYAGHAFNIGFHTVEASRENHTRTFTGDYVGIEIVSIEPQHDSRQTFKPMTIDYPASAKIILG